MKDTITKNTIANNIFYETGIPATMAQEIVDNLFTTIINAAATDGVVKIPKFGSFYVKQKSQRIGRDLNTNEDKIITARKVVSFQPSNQLKQAVNDVTNSSK